MGHVDENHEHNEKKLMAERRALDILLHDSAFRGYSLKEHRDRPDFIVTNGQQDIGIEHCCVDMLNLARGTYEPVDFDSILESVNSFSRIVAVREELMERYERCVAEFSSDIFGCLFLKAAMNHGYQAIHGYDDAGYKAGLNLSRLGLLCEVPMPDTDYMWQIISHDGRIRKQRVKGIPLTALTRTSVCFVSSVFDFVAFVGMPYDSDDTSVQVCSIDNLEHAQTCAGFSFANNDVLKVSTLFLSDEVEVLRKC